MLSFIIEQLSNEFQQYSQKSQAIRSWLPMVAREVIHRKSIHEKIVVSYLDLLFTIRFKFHQQSF